MHLTIHLFFHNATYLFLFCETQCKGKEVLIAIKTTTSSLAYATLSPWWLVYTEALR